MQASSVPGIPLGVDLHTQIYGDISTGGRVKHIWTDQQKLRRNADNRSAERRCVTFPARLTWKDQHGTLRFATVLARNVSDFGVYVECEAPVSIPLYRLVQFHVDPMAGEGVLLPEALLQGYVLSAVYRVSPASASQPQGLALRLMVDPRRAAVSEQSRRSIA